MTTKKFIVFCIFGGLIIFAYGLIHDSIKQWFKSETDYLDNFNGNVNSLKYILQWTRADIQPFVFMGVGRKGFVDRQCEFTNCVVTSRRDLLQDITKFDVIIFDGSVIVSAPILNKDLPSIRTPRQKYIFASMESAHNYPICSGRLDNFFNLSWTYRLDSDARWGYLLVKDINNVVIGPKSIMHWLSVQDMDPVGADFKQKLMSKSKAAAWFVSNCDDKSGRFAFAMELKYELKVYGLVLDIFGRCGTMTCSSGCDGMIAETYYFYLAFENSFSEDYVTEKLLRALNNDAVPVVFGGANYTRFMPDGIYLNARELGPKLLAASMHKLIQEPDQYIKYFKWKNHYSYHSREEEPENNDYCNFCEMLNDDNLMKTETTIRNFREWWDPPGVC